MVTDGRPREDAGRQMNADCCVASAAVRSVLPANFPLEVHARYAPALLVQGSEFRDFAHGCRLLKVALVIRDGRGRKFVSICLRSGFKGIHFPESLADGRRGFALNQGVKIKIDVLRHHKEVAKLFCGTP